MEHTSGKAVVIICGIAGGMGKYFFIDATPFPVKLIQAGVTAVVCALLGALVKHFYDLFLKPRIEKLLKSK